MIHTAPFSFCEPTVQACVAEEIRERQNYRMRVMWTLIAACMLGACGRAPFDRAAQPALIAGDLWIRDVTVISPELPQALPSRHVIARRGRIAAVTAEAPRGPTSGVLVLNGSGKFLTPGLIDGHVHLVGVPGMSPEQEARYPELVNAYFEELPRSYLYFGFTTLVDLNVVDRAPAQSPQTGGSRSGDLRLRRGTGARQRLSDGLSAADGPLHALSNFLHDARQTASIPPQFAAADHSPQATVARVARAGALPPSVPEAPAGRGQSAGCAPDRRTRHGPADAPEAQAVTRPPFGVADIVRRHGDRYLDTHRAWVTGQHRQVLRAIAQCRTAALGGHRDRCERVRSRPSRTTAALWEVLVNGECEPATSSIPTLIRSSTLR